MSQKVADRAHPILIPFLESLNLLLRLYRKYKREQITRKILEYEAEMERDGADEDNRASRRYRPDSDSSSSEESYRHHRRGRRSTRKSGKKVRARSRPAAERKEKSSEKQKSPESSPTPEKPPALPPKTSKKQAKEKTELEKKQGSYHHFRHGNGKARFELIRDSG